MEALRALSLPPGFGFHPTDVELISHYLQKKIFGYKTEFEVIPEVDIYKHEPWDLPAKSQIPTRDCKWYFFTCRDRKYPNGSRSNRATEAGYWKSTGKDRSIRLNNRIIGTKKTLVFHEGKPPNGKRTDWIMHEYYLNENEFKAAPSKDMFVLCRITKRNGLTNEDEEVVFSQIEKNISQSASLPTKNCSKELLDVSAHLIPKKEVCSPAENVDDFGAWVTELYDPDFCMDPLIEPKSGNKVDVHSLSVKHGLEENFFPPNHKEEMNASLTEQDTFCGGFNAHELSQSFGPANYEAADALYWPQLEQGFGMESLLHPGYNVRCMEENMTMVFPTSHVALSDNHCTMIPQDGEERIATVCPNFTGPQGAIVDTGIQIRPRTSSEVSRISSEISSHRIRLQVHKMESRNPGLINQTFLFVSEDTHLDSTCELDQDSIPFRTKDVPAISGDFTNVHQYGADDSASGSNSQHVIRSQERTSKSNKSGSPSKSDLELGSLCASTVSMLRCSKLVKCRHPSKSSRKSHGSVSHAHGFTKGIGPFLRKCSLAKLNCSFLTTCTVGTATLIAFFLVRDVQRSK